MKISFNALFLLAIILVISNTNSYAHIENSYYLSGKIGDLEIGMRLDEFDNICTASYISILNKKEKALRGTIDTDYNYILEGFTWDETNSAQHKNETLILKQGANDSWEGKWISEDSIVKKVFLKPINIDSLNHPFLDVIKKYNVNAYFAYRTKDIIFKKTKTKKLAPEMKVIWYAEPETGIEFFRVANSKQLPDVKLMNELLCYEHLNQVSISLSESNTYKPKNYTLNCSVHFLNPYYLSFTLRIKSSYIGQNVNENIEHYTLSIETAQKIMLEEIIWFGERPQPKILEGSANWFTYRYKIFGEKLIEIFSAAYPEKMIEKEGDACNNTNPKIWQFPTWYISKEGINLGSASQTFDTKCNAPSWLLIPWGYLQEYLVIDNQKIK